jgi:hypothetical protein
VSSPNYLWYGDEAWFSFYGWDKKHIYPFRVRITAVLPNGLYAVEAIDKSDDPFVDNHWSVRSSDLRREYG